MLAVAVVLTVLMFIWQGFHLYSANETASREEATQFAESLHSAGEHQVGLVEDLEHDAVVLHRDLTPDDLAEWAERYQVASADTRAAAAAARTGAGEQLTGAVDLIDATRPELDGRVADVVQVLSTGDDEEVAAAVSDPLYLAARAEFAGAIDGQIADLAADLAAVTAEERLDELHSVAIALVLFSATIGVWGLFGHSLRRSREHLADEQERRLEAEAELSQMEKKEALGLMADGIAHDVKNLTVVILGSADEIRRELPEGHRAGRALNRIEEATRQADDLARSLLAFSRSAESPQGAVDLAELVVDMRQMLRYTISPSIELRVEAPSAAWVRGDAARLQQAVFNLAANAQDAMPRGGRLDIVVRESRPADGEEPAWLLEVEDSGEGMSPDVVEHVFETFFTTRQAGTGFGLGLAIVHQTVLDHGGWITVASRSGGGSTFTIGLPAAAPPAPEHPEPDRDRPRVLVANPDSHIRGLIDGALVAEGCRTCDASTTDQVRTCVAGNGAPIDLVVVDARLLEADLLLEVQDVPVVVTGDPAAAVDPAGRPDLLVMSDPLSLADLTRSVTSLARRASGLVTS